MDLVPEVIDLDCQLFRDRERLQATLVSGHM